MLNLSTQNILLLTAIVIAVELGIFAILLRRQDLFHWTSAGFWAWASFALYFVANPLAVVLTGNNLVRYQVRLSLSGGASRGLWILLVIVIGIASAFVAYLKQPSQKQRIRRNLTNTINVPVIVFLCFWVFVGMYTLLVYRTFRPEGVLVVNARFAGATTGYQYSGYQFLFLPMTILLLSRNKLLHYAGYLLVVLAIIFAMPRGWSRFVIVSFLLLLTLCNAKYAKRVWPSVGWLVILIIFTAGLQIRGHTSVPLDKIDSLFLETTTKSVSQFSNVLSAQDSAMLATFYLQSYLHDSIIGYQYGIPVLNYVVSGWLPYRFFPQKYFLVDWLLQKPYPTKIRWLLYGGKSSLLGDLYANGGLFAVILGAYFFGRLSRLLDRYLESENILIQAIVIAILSQLWMIWGSNMTWNLIRLGFILIPAITFWIVWTRDEQERGNLWEVIDNKYYPKTKEISL